MLFSVVCSGYSSVGPKKRRENSVFAQPWNDVVCTSHYSTNYTFILRWLKSIDVFIAQVCYKFSETAFPACFTQSALSALNFCACKKVYLVFCLKKKKNAGYLNTYVSYTRTIIIIRSENFRPSEHALTVSKWPRTHKYIILKKYLVHR